MPVPPPPPPFSYSANVVYDGVHDDAPRVVLPGSPKEGSERMLNRREIRGSRDDTLVKREPRIAALENGHCVPEDEVDGAVYVAFSVELPESQGVEAVLVSHYAAPVEGRAVRRDAQSHRLFSFRPCVVVEPYVSCDEPVTVHCYKIHYFAYVTTQGRAFSDAIITNNDGGIFAISYQHDSVLITSNLLPSLQVSRKVKEALSHVWMSCLFLLGDSKAFADCSSLFTDILINSSQYPTSYGSTN
ncbi:hypothetical protein G2W53_006081 [Senna tora]|uniref:Uncharacterized protein n=1 Tax=Senna tora TaxID=362788 RepID=A0A835CCJ9_9FABA|nr:hypothetical protein G2W53_006081 [Senna tora]